MIDFSKLTGTDYPSFHMGVLKSLREFDQHEVQGVLAGLIKLTAREECFYAIYLRVQRNVDTLLLLNHVAHFQGTAMLSRAIFELGMDAELLTSIPDGDRRMRVYKVSSCCEQREP